MCKDGVRYSEITTNFDSTKVRDQRKLTSIACNRYCLARDRSESFESLSSSPTSTMWEWTMNRP
jgi:hypothetical protein